MAKNSWNAAERKLLRSLSSTEKIQRYLDAIQYNTDSTTRSPREVMRVGRAHCFDGALFAAAALEFHNERPLVMYVESSADDDDHVLAIFKRYGCWGAIAKSNYTGCRYRDPVYRGPRELVMSYFDSYFNLAAKKTLRGYSLPLDLRKVKDVDWRFSSGDLDFLDRRIKKTREYKVINKRQEALLVKADARLFKAGTIGLKKRGAYKVQGALI